MTTPEDDKRYRGNDLSGGYNRNILVRQFARPSGYAGLILDLTLIFVCSIPLLFFQLGALPVVLWDESRLAINALEMHRAGWSLTTTYLGHPDLWNTKPPLMIWLMAGSISLFGPLEWSLRLPSAFAGLATSVIAYQFCRGVTESRAAGLAGASILLTTYGFVGAHVTRTGDYDALLVLFTTALCTSCYWIIEQLRHGEKPALHLLAYSSLALTGALMTKGVAGLLVLPGLALASLAGGAIVQAVRDKRVWVAASLPIVVTAAFYFARDLSGAGYIEAVWRNELTGRFVLPIEGHKESPIFYAVGLLSPFGTSGGNFYLGSAFPWSWLAVFLIPFRPGKPRLASASAFLQILILAFVFVISIAQTKISWYVAPAFPLIACVVAIKGYALLCSESKSQQASKRRPSSLVILGSFTILVAILGGCILQEHRAYAASAPWNPELRSAALIHQIASQLPPGTKLRIVRTRALAISQASSEFIEYSPQEHYYAAVMRGRGIDARLVPPEYHPLPGEVLAWCGPVDPAGHVPESRVIASGGPCRAAVAKSTGTTIGAE